MNGVCPVCSVPNNTLTPVVVENTKRNAIFRAYVF